MTSGHHHFQGKGKVEKHKHFENIIGQVCVCVKTKPLLLITRLEKVDFFFGSSWQKIPTTTTNLTPPNKKHSMKTNNSSSSREKNSSSSSLCWWHKHDISFFFVTKKRTTTTTAKCFQNPEFNRKKVHYFFFGQDKMKIQSEKKTNIWHWHTTARIFFVLFLFFSVGTIAWTWFFSLFCWLLLFLRWFYPFVPSKKKKKKRNPL